MTWKKREERLRRFQRYIQEKKHRAKYEIKRKRLYSCDNICIPDQASIKHAVP